MNPTFEDFVHPDSDPNVEIPSSPTGGVDVKAGAPTKLSRVHGLPGPGVDVNVGEPTEWSRQFASPTVKVEPGVPQIEARKPNDLSAEDFGAEHSLGERLTGVNPFASRNDAIETLKDKYVAPTVSKMQSNVGKPVIADPILSAFGYETDEVAKRWKGYQGPNATSGTELLMRHLLTATGGKGVLETLSPAERDDALHALEGTLGKKGAWVATHGARLMGELPYWIAGGVVLKGLGLTGAAGEAGEAPEAISRLTKAMELAKEGAYLGAGKAAITEGEDIGEGALTGAAGNLGIAALGKGVKGGLNLLKTGVEKAKPIAVASGSYLKQLATELVERIAPVGKAELPMGFRPKIAAIGTDAEGRFVANLFDGKETHPLPLETAKDAGKFAKVRDEHGLDVLVPNDTSLGKSDLWKERVYGPKGVPTTGAHVISFAPSEGMKLEPVSAGETPALPEEPVSKVDSPKAGFRRRRADGQAAIAARQLAGAERGQVKLPAPAPKNMAQPKVPPPPTVGPGELPPNLINDYDRVADLVNEANQTPGFWRGLQDRMRGMFAHPSVSTALPYELASLAAKIRNAPKLTDSVANGVQDMFRRALGTKASLSEEFGKVLDVALERPETFPHLEDYPQWHAIKDKMQPMLERYDSNRKLIAELGGISENLLAEQDAGVKDHWLARMYWSKLNPKLWNKRVGPQIRSSDLMAKAIEYATKENAALPAKKQLSPADIAHHLDSLTRAEDPIGAFGDSPIGRMHNSLKQRQDIPEVYRDLMGEVHAGTYRFATSLGRQEGLISHLKAFAELSKDAEVFSHQWKPGWKQLPDSASYGLARRGFVRPDVFDAVADAPKMLDRPSNFVRAISQHIKGNLAVGGGAGPISHHMMGNALNSVIAGGIDPFHPVNSVKGFAKAIGAHLDYAKNPLEPGELGKFKLEALQDGALAPGYGETELGAGTRDKALNQLADAWSKANPKHGWDAMDVLGGALSAPYKANKVVNRELGRAYDLVAQQTFELGNYIALRGKFEAQGMGTEEARKLATVRVRQSFANPGSIGKAFDIARSGPGGFIPFLTPMLEQARIVGSIPSRIAKGEKDLAYRLMFTGGAFGAGLGVGRAMMHLNGISDEDAHNAIENGVSARRNASSPMLYPIPFKDDKGRIQIYDATHNFPFLHLMRGNPQDNPFARVLDNILKVPVEGTPYEGVVDKWTSGVGLISPPENDPHYKSSEGKFLGFLHAANRSGLLGPSAISGAADTLGRMRDNGSSEPLTGGQAAARLLGGASIIPVGEKALGNVRKERSAAYGNAAHDMKNQMGHLMRELQGANPERVKAITDELAALQARAREMGQRHQQEMSGGQTQ